jgi:hypothetical protein
MHKAPGTKGLAMVVEVTAVEAAVVGVVVVAAGALEHTRTPCEVGVTTASTEVPSAEVTRPLPDSAAGAVGDTNGAFALATVVVAPGLVVAAVVVGAVVVVTAVVVGAVVVVTAVVVGAVVVVTAVVVGAVVVVTAVVVGAVVVVVVAAVVVVVSATVVSGPVVVVSTTVVAGETLEACAIPSCAKPAMPMAPARRRTLVARVVECVMSCSFRLLQVRTTKERHDLKSQWLSTQVRAGAGKGV